MGNLITQFMWHKHMLFMALNIEGTLEIHIALHGWCDFAIAKVNGGVVVKVDNLYGYNPTKHSPKCHTLPP